jgi:hypothetical protein
MYYGLGLSTRWLFAGGDLASGTPGGTMDDREIMQRFQELWADLRPEDTFAAKKPLLQRVPMGVNRDSQGAPAERV